MAENHEKENEYTFIQETIRPKKRTKVKRFAFNICLAVVFGLVSCIVFCLAFPLCSRIFGIDRELISFQTEGGDKVTISPSPSISPTIAPTPEPTKKPDHNPTTVIQKVPANIEDYIAIYGELDTLVQSVNKSVVTITSVKSKLDVFSNPSEKTDQTSGMIIANNSKELLILADSNRVQSSNSLKVTFVQGQTVDATLYNVENELGLAIVSVDVKDIKEEILNSIEVVKLGESSGLEIGRPVIAVGNPNGYMYSVQYGFVSNAVNPAYYTDGKISLINTTIPYNSKGEGFLVDLSGQVIGVITNQEEFKGSLNKSINTCIGISEIKGVIERLVNQSARMYFGVVANDITTEVGKKLGVTEGVYVMEVRQDSPAYNAGLKKGDIITALNKTTIGTVSTLNAFISTKKEKDTIDVHVIRIANDEKKEMTVPVDLIEVK